MNITDLVDHIEISHEREIAPGNTYANMAKMHRVMHRDDDRFGINSQWNHYHKNGETIYK